MLTPAKRATPGSPRARPWNVTNPHVEPASISPMKVKLPLQPAPPASGPVAMNDIATGDGVFVMPGCCLVVPLGAAGVPPQVQVVVARAAAAGSSVIATAVALMSVRVLMSQMVGREAGARDGGAPELDPERMRRMSALREL